MTADTHPPSSAQETAERSSAAMQRGDAATAHMGIALTQVSPGRATMTMTVQAFMLNGHGTCHGGFITTLADSAFAFACNTYNEVTVASGFSVELLAPAAAGDVLTASGQELSRSGRLGLYDVHVHNQDGKLIALFRGKSYAIKGKKIYESL